MRSDFMNRLSSIKGYFTDPQIAWSRCPKYTGITLAALFMGTVWVWPMAIQTKLIVTGGAVATGLFYQIFLRYSKPSSIGTGSGIAPSLLDTLRNPICPLKSPFLCLFNDPRGVASSAQCESVNRLYKSAKKSSIFSGKASYARCLIFNLQSDLLIKVASVKRLVGFLCAEKKVNKEIGLFFVSKRRIAALHSQFFHDKTATDCLSFPLDDPDLLGEIFVCPKVAVEYDPEKPYVETSLYIIHAFLHLLGYDDQQPRLRQQMRREQNRLLKKAIKNQ